MYLCNALLRFSATPIVVKTFNVNCGDCFFITSTPDCRVWTVASGETQWTHADQLHQEHMDLLYWIERILL